MYERKTPIISIDSNPLNVTDKFTYLNSTLSQNTFTMSCLQRQSATAHLHVCNGSQPPHICMSATAVSHRTFACLQRQSATAHLHVCNGSQPPHICMSATAVSHRTFACLQRQSATAHLHVCNGSQPPHICMSATAVSHRTFACLQRQSATEHLHPSFPQCRLRTLSEMCAARHDMIKIACGCAAHVYSFCSPSSPTDVSLPGWRPVPSTLGWQSAMHAVATCDQSGVILLGGCCISLDCYWFAPTFIATSRQGRAFTHERLWC